MKFALGFLIGISLIVLPFPAHAACPIELAVYSTADGKAGIDFSPNHEAGATVTNSFKLVLGDAAVPGLVQWSSDAARPFGSLMLNCPEGDVTGDEIAACTVWQRVIYSVEQSGAVGLLPAQGKPAPKRIILAGLGPSLAISAALKGRPLPELDMFELSGCQE